MNCWYWIFSKSNSCLYTQRVACKIKLSYSSCCTAHPSCNLSQKTFSCKLMIKSFSTFFFSFLLSLYNQEMASVVVFTISCFNFLWASLYISRIEKYTFSLFIVYCLQTSFTVADLLQELGSRFSPFVWIINPKKISFQINSKVKAFRKGKCIHRWMAFLIIKLRKSR